jgi:creatinine amidohydrolase
MKLALCTLAMTCVGSYAQSKGPLVEFEMMTAQEVRQARDSGKTTILIYNGGTEYRGPQNVNGGHTLIAREVSRMIALKLGNALTAPVLAYSVNNQPDLALPGTIGLTAPLFAAVNEQIAEQFIGIGFKNVVLMGDHGGGQKELGEVATKLDQKYHDKGIRVVYCDQVYTGTKEHPGAQADFEKWLGDNGYPSGGHGGVSDTSEMIYLGQDKGWVRMNLMATAVGDPVGRGARDPNKPLVHNGITGDARPSTAALGKRFIDMKVDYAVRQINDLLATKGTSAAQ